MRVCILAWVAAAAVLQPATASADDPHDPAMRSAAARERDREIIRQLNLKELARVRHRDAQFAEAWQAWRANGGSHGGAEEYQARTREHQRATADYARRRARYERELAEWRRDVSECRQGNYSACDSGW